MNKECIINDLNEVYIEESFAWQPSSIFVHKMSKSNSIVDDRIQTLIKRDIIQDAKNVYMISFLHPDGEFCVSFIAGAIPKKGQHKVFFALADPEKLMINKRMTLSGISLEAISKPTFDTTMFLSSGRPTSWKLLNRLDCHTISTTIPFPLPLGVFLWENFRSKLDKNKLGLSFIQMKRAKFWTLPQLVTKSNYLFQYKMIVK